MLASFNAGPIKPTEKKSPDNGGRGFRLTGRRGLTRCGEVLVDRMADVSENFLLFLALTVYEVIYE